jgi:hypothetical protein
MARGSLSLPRFSTFVEQVKPHGPQAAIKSPNVVENRPIAPDRQA